MVHQSFTAEQFEEPEDWICRGTCVSRSIVEELRRRYSDFDWQKKCGHLDIRPVDTTIRNRTPELWCDQNFYPRLLRWQFDLPVEALEILGEILCRSLEIPHDCKRELGVYCCHTQSEVEEVHGLITTDLEFRLKREYRPLDTEAETYHQLTDNLFWKFEHYLAWESIFPKGIDMEALSPRDVNAHIRVKQTSSKARPAAAKLPQKEKDHPPPPPEEVKEPPSSDRRNGAAYKTGRLLGKGGFAICYEGTLVGTKQVYALKIVKSHMPQKKMEQKFQTELQIHSKMNHVNIVQFHRAFSFDKCTYIVLELCPNGSLMDMVKKRKYITEPEVRFWTVQMAGAIKYMHNKGIIHRDLKMGNIFLDKDMNIKIGDFGLAALLMSGKDWNACRRTTLCGTPNYIAPEILSKDKGGHDHAVDIWSLGIIIFAMLTGKPPFQSATADEIYRRARERDYDWPKLDTSENYISQETKDLVSQMLVLPEDRPDPDTIVQHPFFSCGYIPQSEEMTVALREKQPAAAQFLSVGIRAGRQIAYLRNLKKLCIKCEVGPWNINSEHHTSTYREVADEEKAGLTPAVPLPEDVVYRPFHEWLEEQKEALQNGSKAADLLEKVLAPASKQKVSEKCQPSSTRLAIQSFAAQQRARPGPVVTRTRQPSQQATLPATATKTSIETVDSLAPTKIVDVEDRLAADLAQQLNAAEAERQSHGTGATFTTPGKPASIFNPREQLEELSNTKPDEVLHGLRRLQAELERALNSRSTVSSPKAPTSSPTIVVKWVDYTNKFGLGYILSNGSVGCIFKEASADPADSSKGHVPPACVVVRDAERHLQNRTNEAYIDRHQIVPISGPNIEFYENRGISGIYRGKVNPQNYKISISQTGEAGRLSRGQDEWDDRKREKIVLWKKFANYMTAYGRDQDFPMDAVLTKRPGSVPAGNVITFYQRFGDVGCWAFWDGHFQFNFPDHTKIVLSADGTWCDFYHLSLEAARDLSVKGTLPASALDDRQHLSYPLQTLLNFMVKPARTATRKRPEIDPMVQGIPQANDFRKKVEFIRLVVKEWVTNGGLGVSDLSTAGRLRWQGVRELVNVKVPYKHVWVTVGARNGDDRRVAWFNPRKPTELVPDIET